MDGTNFILWTTEEGGYFKATMGTREQYDEAVKTGVLTLRADWRGIGAKDRVEFFFIAYGAVEDNYDQGLGCSRDDEAGMASYVAAREAARA